jgi:NCS1 family nucleobase:cation symporter-1
VYDLNTFVVFFGTILGSFFVYLFSNFIGMPSQKFGIPFAVFLRSSLGFKGAKYFGLLRALIGIFMFGIQTYILSKAVGYLIRILIFSIDNSALDQEIFLTFLLGLNIIDWISFTIVIIFQALIFSVGIQFNKKLINFSAITVYVGMILFFFSVFLSDVKITTQAFVDILNFDSFLDVRNIAPLLTVAGTIFAYFSIIIISFGDFSRYVKNEQNLKRGNLSLILNLILFSFFGPIFGVMIVDYYLIKKGSLKNKDIYSLESGSAYFYSKGWHIKALYSLILGFIFSASTIWNVNLMFLQSYAWIIGSLVSSMTYYLLAKK